MEWCPLVVDHAFTDDIQQLVYQVCALEKELQLLKETMRTEGPNNEMVVVGYCLIHIVIVLGIWLY
ncbi:hypothetical protein IGI04_030463, partial [Brassica rapa subsp. trilocularis]